MSISRPSIAESIEHHTGTWPALAGRLEELAAKGAESGSQLDLDNRAAAVGTSSKAIAAYILNRASNAARFVRELHRMVIEQEPGRLSLNYTALHPLLRGALEDGTALIALLKPAEQSERLTRALRSLFADGNYLVGNHLLLAQALSSEVEMPAGLAEAVSTHMSEEQDAMVEEFKATAAALALNYTLIARSVSNKTLLTEAFGPDSQTYAIWKVLSDLSHFSFAMNKHLSSYQADHDTTLENVVLVVFISEVNKTLFTAANLLEAAVSGPGAAEA